MYNQSVELAKKYLKETIEKEILPSMEAFVIWLMEKESKTYDEATTMSREYKGYINTNAIAFLKDRAGSARRNSLVYIQLLKNLTDNDDLNNNEKLVINIDLNTDKGDNGF